VRRRPHAWDCCDYSFTRPPVLCLWCIGHPDGSSQLSAGVLLGGGRYERMSLPLSGVVLTEVLPSRSIGRREN
jgi:hypothetical protein